MKRTGKDGVFIEGKRSNYEQYKICSWVTKEKLRKRAGGL